jgi:crossover junction endodeoxyribonuclease RuvC
MPERIRVVLGVDPGLATTGIGVVEERNRRYAARHWECIRTAPEMPLPDRLMALYRACAALVRAYRPAAIAMERLFFSRNAKTAIVVGQAQGAILLAAAGTGLGVYDYTPVEVKQAVTGSGRADKAAVGSLTAKLLGLAKPPRPDDAADALAVAYCHLVSTRGGRLRPPVWSRA